MGHHVVDDPLGRRFGCRTPHAELRHFNLRHQDCDRLGEIEHREIRIGGYSDNEVTLVEVLPGQTAGLVSENQCRVFDAALAEQRNNFPRGHHREVVAAPTGGCCNEGSEICCCVGQAVPVPDLETFASPARPVSNLRVLWIDDGTNQVDPRDAEVCRYADRRAEIAGEGRLHEDH